MTSVIIDDILPRTQAVATGGQTVFSTNWTANYSTDVDVYSRAANVAANDATQQLNTSQYTVAFIGGSLTVQVTLTSGATAGDIVTIVRNTPADRENLYTNTNFTPSMLNNDFGILTLVDQQSQLAYERITPKYNYSAIIEPLVDTVLPILEANECWAKNDSDTAIIGIIPLTSSDVAGIDFIIGTANAMLPDAQALGDLATGVVFNTTTAGTGVLTTVPFAYFANAPVNTNITSMTGLTGVLSQPTAIVDSFGNPVLSFNYSSGSPTDYLEIYNGIDSMSGIQVISSNANASVGIFGKGSGGVEVGSVEATTIPFAISSEAFEVTAKKFNFYIPVWTGLRTLTFPDADVTLAAGTTLPDDLTDTHIFVGNASNKATDVAMSGDAALANTGAVTVSKIGGVSITLGGAFSTAGAFSTVGAFTVVSTYTGATNLTYPTSGTLATTTDLTAYLPLAGGTMAGTINMDGHTITNLPLPSIASEPATKAYVDNVVAGVQMACLVATDTDMPTWTYANGASGVGATLTAPVFGASTFDGVVPVNGNRVLVLFQTTNPAWQGAYTIVQGTGGTPTVLTRATDWDQAAEMNPGDQFSVVQGTLYGASQWMFSQVNAITVGTTALTFNQIAGQGALLKANNLSDLPSPSTARTNLGLAIGTNVQAFDAGLQSISGLTTGANSMLYTTALDTYAVITPVNSAVLISSAGGVPSWGTTLPNINLGIPTAIVLTSGTGLPIGGLTGLGTGVATALATSVTGSGGIVLASSPAITTPTIKGSNGFNVITFSDVASTTDYFSLTSGIANGAILGIVSSNPNASWSISAKGSGGIAINPGGTSPTPFALYFGSSNVAFNVAALTGARTLTFPDANRDLTQIPAATATANQILLSGSSAQPTWSTTTYPSTNAVNTMMYASAANVLGVITPVNSAVLVSSAGGVPSWSTTPFLGAATATSIALGAGSVLSNYTTWATYTPTVTLVGGAGNTVPTFTAEFAGRWIRIGNMVTVIITMVNSAGGTAGAGTGAFTVALPVTPGASCPTQYAPIAYYSAGANTYSAIPILTASTATVTCYYILANVLTALNGNAFSNASRAFQVTLTYEV